MSLFPLLLRTTLCGLLAGSFAAAQTKFISSSYFPADLEFKELLEITEEKSIDTSSELAALEYGNLLEEAGIVKYVQRKYAVEDQSELTIEIFTFEDYRGPFSLLTLSCEIPITEGPPGKFLATFDDSLMFVQGPQWVRIRTDADAELMRRVAISVSNRIGPTDDGLPYLITNLNQFEYDPASLRYMLGPEAQSAFAHTVGGRQLEFPALVEIAQARNGVTEDSGILTLVNFPTPQMAEDYFDSGSAFEETQHRNDSKIYIRRAGPILAILEGNIDPDRASGILEPLEFTYSIQWIYDKNNRMARIVWGVPVGILGTVVRSLLFVVLLGGMSVLGGVVIAGVRIAMRTYGPRRLREHAYSKEMIRLKIDEN